MTHSPGADSPTNSSQKHVDTAVHNIEHGLRHGQGNSAIHHEVEALRHSDTVNNKLDSQAFHDHLAAVDKKLHQDGFLPKLHIVLDESNNATLVHERVQHSQTVTKAHTSSERHNHGHGQGHEKGHLEVHHVQGHQHIESHAALADNTDNTNVAGPASARADNVASTYDAANANPASLANLPDSQLTVGGPPTITAEKINLVLAQYHSPAAGMGQYIYDEGLKHGINPAMALAFYVVESQCGTKGLGAKNNSWGNVRGHGEHGYKPFASIEESLDQWYGLINRKYQGEFHANTLGQIIPHYAPDKDGNNERAYVAYVGQLVRKWAS